MSTLTEIQKKIGKAKLIAVSKTKPAEKILELYQEGQKVFGENYVQELVEKKKRLDAMGATDIDFHFIGHLQSNKVKVVLPCVSTIHSVDSIRLYEEILKRAAELQKKIEIYFQVNIDDEDSKNGFSVTDLNDLVTKVKSKSSPWVIFAGLMTIPNPHLNPSSAFQKMQKLSAKYATTLGAGLSMGMSEDFSEAVAHGSTAVRIGSALFGSRM